MADEDHIDPPQPPSINTGAANIYEMLSEEECYLAAILQDSSGLDIAEFCWQAPENEDNCFRAWPYQWCFAAETLVLTREGHKQIADLVGPVTLLTEANTGRGAWVEAEVQRFGKQQIWEVELERYGTRKIIRTTAEHRWFADAERRSRRTYPEVLTRHLRPGMFLKSVLPHRGAFTPAPYGIAHGLVWGDGTREKNGGCHLNLWGEKLECARYLMGDGVELHRDDVQVPGRSWSLLPYSFKEPVNLAESPSYLYGWLAGYMATDGSVSPDGTCQIQSSDAASLELVRDVCVRLGITIGAVEAHPTIGADGGSDYFYVVTLTSSDLSEDFFLRTSHREKWLRRPDKAYRPREWSVVEVRKTDRVEDVFCAVVPDTHSFVLDGYILTGNCWWRCDDPLTIDQCARSVGKSLSIKVRMFAFPFIHPGQEALITTPEKIHLVPVTDLIETQFEACRLGREMLHPKSAFKHQPFHANFANGARILGRIPQRDGKGVKGVHPLWLEMDEASDYPEPGWKEIIETLKRGQEGAMWRAHGVTRGLRDSFYKNSAHGQDDPPLRYVSHRGDGKWTVHRIVGMARPNWTDEERAEKEQQYGSREDPDYRRNVLGAHGDAQNPLFVMHRLMKVVDDDPSTEYNTDDYFHFSIKDTELDRMQADIVDLLNFPQSHRKYKTTWIGADIGYTQDPTEILIFAEYPLEGDELKDAKARKKAVPKPGLSRVKCICRVSLRRISEPAQADVLMAVTDFYKPRAFGMDSTGAGLPLFQQVQRRMNDVADATGSKRAREAAESLKPYNFSSKIVVDFDETIELDDDLTVDDRVKEAGITRNVLEYSTDVLRTYVDDQRLWLPWDRELIGEMSGQTFSYSKATMDRYGRRRIFSQGTFHALDAMRMAVLAHRQFSIEALLATKDAPQAPVIDTFILP